MDESKNLKENTYQNQKEAVNDDNKLELNIDNYEGPLDLLLDLAKTQKVDLMKISIVQLADQYISFVERLKKFRNCCRFFSYGFLVSIFEIKVVVTR